MAEARAGAPVTSGPPKLYPATPECPIHLYDSEGLTIESALQKQMLKKFVQERKDAVVALGSLGNDIHAVWWVVDASTGRVDTSGIKEVASEVFADVITFIVLNKCDKALVDDVDAIVAALEVSSAHFTFAQAPSLCYREPCLPVTGTASGRSAAA